DAGTPALTAQTSSSGPAFRFILPSSHHSQTSSPSNTRAVRVLLASVEAVACIQVAWPEASGRQAITREYPGASAVASVTVTGEWAGSVETITSNCGEGSS